MTVILKAKSELLQIQDQTILDCKEKRQEWEREAMIVELSYKGIKYPEYSLRLDQHRNDPTQDKPIVNLLKRQVRSILNYFLNNEPHVSVRKTLWMKDVDVTNSSNLLTRDFWEWDFYDEEMDNIAHYWIKRWVIYVLAYMNNDGKIQVRVDDTLDSYIDVSAKRKKDIRKIVFTFIKTLDEMKAAYTTDYYWENIDWDAEMTQMEKTESDTKRKFVKEPSTKWIFMLREWWYMDFTVNWYKDWDTINPEQERKTPCVVKILSTKTRILKKEVYMIDFLPVTYYAPINDPDNLFPQSWVFGIIEPEKIVNNILNKLTRIVTTWGRAMYIKEWTRITKGTNKALQSIWIEIYEISWTQDIPREAELLTISQSQMILLDRMIQEAEKEWGMMSDIMWQSSLWADASWRAIEALQAWSKWNVWMAMIELNKFMSRLAKIYFKLYQQTWGNSIEIYNEELDTIIKIDPKKLWIPKIHIEPRSAFDDITAKIDGIEMLKWIKQFDPETKISAEIIVEIFSLRNELAAKIGRDMRKEEDPDIKYAESAIQLLLAWQDPAVSETDNHEIHMAYLAKVIDKTWDKLPDEIKKNFILKYKQHEAWLWEDPSQNRKTV